MVTWVSQVILERISFVLKILIIARIYLVESAKGAHNFLVRSVFVVETFHHFLAVVGFHFVDEVFFFCRGVWFFIEKHFFSYPHQSLLEDSFTK